MLIPKPIRAALSAVSVLALGACHVGGSASTSQPPQQPAPAPQPYYPPYAQQQPYPQQPYAQQPYPQQQPAPQPAPQQPVQRPLLAPLVGLPAMQQELRSILPELIGALSPQDQALVAGIPLVFDPSVEVNAYAGCDERGAPFLAATTGIFEAVDAIAQTKATDELFGTRTYDAYTNAVLPQMLRSEKARAALPAGIIPTNLGPDPRRWSRAHELFDDIIAFTFGHELAHHYRGHTGCAKGQPTSIDPMIAQFGRVLSNIAPPATQFQEGDADRYGTYDALAAGRRRRPQYQWSETGGVLLLDYFSRLENAAGGGSLLSQLMNSWLRTHPAPSWRLTFINGYAWDWRRQNPG